MSKDYLKNALWTDKKRTIFGLPISFTRYVLQEEKLLIRSGFFNLKEEEVRLYRITDITMKATFGQRIFGVGSIVCDSTDKSAGKFEIKNIKKARDTKDLLSNQIELERERRRVAVRENMIDTGYEASDYDEFDEGFDDK